MMTTTTKQLIEKQWIAIEDLAVKLADSPKSFASHANQSIGYVWGYMVAKEEHLTDAFDHFRVYSSFVQNLIEKVNKSNTAN